MSVTLARLVRASGLPRHLKETLAALAEYAKDDGTSIFPSVPRLADDVSKSARAVQMNLTALLTLGMITTEYRRGGRGLTTVYRININALPPRTSSSKPRKRFRVLSETETPKPFPKRVQPFPEKGATNDRKGRNGFARSVQGSDQGSDQRSDQDLPTTKKERLKTTTDDATDRRPREQSPLIHRPRHPWLCDHAAPCSSWAMCTTADFLSKPRTGS